MNRRLLVLTALLLPFLTASCSRNAGEERNVALFRAATASSAYDYNLTAQLATDGIVERGAPAGMHLFLNGDPVPREEADWLLDERDKSKFTCSLNSFELELRCDGCGITTDRVGFYGTYSCNNNIAYAPYRCTISVTRDGTEWIEAGRWEGVLDKETIVRSGGELNISAPVGKAEYCGVKVKVSIQTSTKWTFNELKFFLDGEQIEVRPSSVFSSWWVSRTGRDEWISVDLGAETSLKEMRLHWGNPPLSGSVQTSSDGRKWKTIAAVDSSVIALKGKGRYVKLLLDATADCRPFSLSEMVIVGSNSLERRETGWELVRADRKNDPDAWLPATVPGTVLTSYLDDGAVPDPFYSDNNTQISESYFLSDYIYRGLLQYNGNSEKVWLDFDGINWKADVSLNGWDLGSIEGAFTSASFDVSDLVIPGDNELEVHVHCPAHPGSNKADNLARCARNGGKLGADNPTFHATVGWDWMPSVHDRNIGIWGKVGFRESGAVTIGDPVVRTRLLLDGSAEVTVGASLTNRSGREAESVWRCSIAGRDLERPVSLPAGGSAELSEVVIIDNPELWWPNGYGEQNLYEVKMSAGNTDSLSFKTGLREVTYNTDDHRLSIFVNGRRFIARGGNWGFPEALMRYTAREYDIAVGLHALENFNIIRNWVGMTGDEAFYEACDRHGIMVWQDFWLANPVDGPEPDDEEMFMANADNFVRRIRNHPCIVLYCGRNEGTPPANLDKALGRLVEDLAPGMIYFPDSSRDIVSGHGPYNRRTALQNFTSWGQGRFHSELGMPNVPNYESLVRFIPEEHLWPQDDIWGYHNWTKESAQSIDSFNAAVENMFGTPEDARQFCEWSQWVNYDGFRSIFESRSAERRGLTIWMSHSAWPDLVFFTYDYYFDTDGGYFGCRKACEPIHIQWNPSTRMVEVVNVCASLRKGLRAEAEVLDMYGRKIDSLETVLDSSEDSTVECFRLDVPCGQEVFHYSLKLFEGDNLLSRNFYVQGLETDNFKILRKLPKASVKSAWDGATLTLTNSGDVPAMMVRLIARDASSGEQVLPAVYSDNYFHLMPGETRKIDIRSWDGDIALKPEIRGFNL